MNVTMIMIELVSIHVLVVVINAKSYMSLLVCAILIQSIHSPSMRSGYHHKIIHHLNAVHLPLCLLR